MIKKDLLIRASATAIFFVGVMALNGGDASATTSTLMSCNSNGAYSETYQESDWDFSFVRTQSYNEAREYPSINQFIDLNGDGLTDYVNAYTKNDDSYYSNGGYTYSGCVFLNNGHGFEQVHYCIATITKNSNCTLSQSFDGDCAG